MSRLDFPATGRNREPLLEALRPMLTAGTRVVEIACGSGQHAAFMCRHLPSITWLPTDLDPVHVASANAWRETDNQLEARVLDVTQLPWTVQADVVFSANMIHIAPFEATLGLLEGAASTLGSGGLLVLYGPFIQPGIDTAPSNLRFDQSLQRRDPSWGIRDLGDIQDRARALGLRWQHTTQMPANNLTVVFRSD
jgi:SAM-dependent methyltransferase